VTKAVEAGFSIIKLKGGRDLNKEDKFLESMSAEFPALKWRIDFNESLSPGQAADFLLGLSEKTRQAIDFIEDPCPFSEATWPELYRKTRVKLAIDHEAAPHRVGAQVTVIKPAVDEPYLLGEAAIAHQQRAVLTSYMDHPFGQSFAAWEAARLELQLPGLVGVCGLQTHHLFETDEFSEMLGPWSPVFQIPSGTGLGFDDQLEALLWTRLY
jgi:O-succinylbenzoate synthase